MRTFFGFVLITYALAAIVMLNGCEEVVRSEVDTVTIVDTIIVDSSFDEPVRFVVYSVCKVKCYDNYADTLLWEYELSYGLKSEFADTMSFGVTESIRLETDTPMYDRVQVISPVLEGRDYLMSSTGMWSLIRE